MIRISSSTKVNSMDKMHPPVCTCKSGDIVEFETLDCFAGQIQSESQVIGSLDWTNINPATGPLFIEGAEPGDVLKVSVLDIEVGDHGVMTDGPGEGVLGDVIKEGVTKILPIRDGKVIFNDKLSFDIDPMIGVIGVAAKDEGIPTGTPGEHGSNMDCTKIKKGASVYLPVFHKGALLSMGDLHAKMGDGEVGVCGVEASGKVTVKVEVIKHSSIPTPFIVDKTHFMTVYSSKTVDEACVGATKQMFGFLMNAFDLSDHDAQMLLSVTGNLSICQIVDPERTVRMELPIEIAKAYGYEFK